MDKYGELLENIEFFALISIADKVYGPYVNSKSRKFVIIRDDKGNVRTVSYPKFLLEKHLNRPLDKNLETVDHLNFDKDDNRLENLRIVPRDQHSADDTRRVKLVEFTCDTCGNKFERSPRLVRDKSKKGNRGLFCSRRCAGIHSRKVQLGLADDLPIQPFVESEYYRRKNIQAMADYLILKYNF